MFCVLVLQVYLLLVPGCPQLEQQGSPVLGAWQQRLQGWCQEQQQGHAQQASHHLLATRGVDGLTNHQVGAQILPGFDQQGRMQCWSALELPSDESSCFQDSSVFGSTRKASQGPAFTLQCMEVGQCGHKGRDRRTIGVMYRPCLASMLQVGVYETAK